MDNPVLISVVGFVVLLVLVVLLVTSRYKVAGPNQAFIVTGEAPLLTEDPSLVREDTVELPAL